MSSSKRSDHQGVDRKLRVIFVAALTLPTGGARGGQLTAARLLLGSGIAEKVEWHQICSSAPTLPPPPLGARALSALSRVWRFMSAIRSADVALIFTSDGLSLIEKGIMVVVARLMGRRAVIRFGSGKLEVDARSLGWKMWLRIVGACSGGVVCQGRRWIGLMTRTGISKKKLRLIPNPVRLPSTVDRQRPRGSEARVLFVGNLVREKGVFEAIEVIEHLRSSGINARLVLVGSGAAEPSVRARITAANLIDHVSLFGWLGESDVDRELQRADVFLFPSKSEGLPNAVLEAMASGLPVVATSVGSLDEWIVSGHNGILVDVNDIASMAFEVEALINDPEKRRALGSAARKTVEQSLSVDSIWPQYFQVLNEASVRNWN